MKNYFKKSDCISINTSKLFFTFVILGTLASCVQKDAGLFKSFDKKNLISKSLPNAEPPLLEPKEKKKIVEKLIVIPKTCEQLGNCLQTQTQVPTQTQTQTQTQVPTQTQTQTQAPVQTPTQTQVPTQTQTQAPVQTPNQTQVAAQAPTQTQAPVQTPTQTQAPVQTPTQTQAPVQTPTQTQAAVQTPTQTQAAVQTPTQTQTCVRSLLISFPDINYKWENNELLFEIELTDEKTIEFSVPNKVIDKIEDLVTGGSLDNEEIKKIISLVDLSDLSDGCNIEIKDEETEGGHAPETNGNNNDHINNDD